MNSRILKHLILTFSFGIAGMLVAGQNSAPTVEKKLAADTIRIGSQTRITLSIASPQDYIWQWPDLTDKITDKIEIVSQTGIDTIQKRKSDLMLLKKELLITSFDSGYQAIPPFVFKYQVTDDTTWSVIETEAALLYVSGLDVDLASPIRDIKGPEKAPVTISEILPWLLILALVISGALLFMYYIKKRREKSPVIPVIAKPTIPPHTIALEALEKLRQKKLWQSGQIKEYHSEITDILRHYLDGRYRIMAVEMTTAEIMEAVYTFDIPSKASEKLRKVFERADLVKFAKNNPLPAEHDESLMLAMNFVRETIPHPMEQPQNNNLNHQETFTPEDINK